MTLITKQQIDTLYRKVGLNPQESGVVSNRLNKGTLNNKLNTTSLNSSSPNWNLKSTNRFF